MERIEPELVKQVPVFVEELKRLVGGRSWHSLNAWSYPPARQHGGGTMSVAFGQKLLL